MKMAYSQRLQRILLSLFLTLWKLKMDLFYNARDVTDGGMVAVPSSSSKKELFFCLINGACFSNHAPVLVSREEAKRPLIPEQEHGTLCAVID